MSNTVLETSNVTKKYGDFSALSDVSIKIGSGKIYGLIGQNGAGKTTLMRIIAGLTFPSSGMIALFGESSRKGLEQKRRKMGTMIENPSVVGHLSAHENLKLQCRLRGIKDMSFIDEVLELVSLSGTGKKKAKDFSLGMKQRLGIAITLLGEPEILMLDEPISGLDPEGVVEIRNLLKRLSQDRQITILLSSHNLTELFQTVTDLIIINQGKVIRKITREELGRSIHKRLIIDSSDNEKAVQVLENQLDANDYKQYENGIHLYDFPGNKETVSKALMENGVVVTTFVTREDTLEEYYLKLIHEEDGNGQSDPSRSI